MDRMFSGMSQTIVRCAKCKYESLTCNPFTTLSLMQENNIVKGIRDYLAEDTISGTYTCDKCHQKSKARVRNEFIKLPKVLILHIKRFDI
jgi:ubiquitin C-terminal hydrolase